MQDITDDKIKEQTDQDIKRAVTSTASKWVLRNPKVIIFAASSFVILLLILAVFGTGMAAAMKLGNFLSDAWAAVTGINKDDNTYVQEDKRNWMEELDATDLLNYIKDGTIIYDNELNKLMKMNKSTFLYMLDLCVDYEKAREESRSITIEYISEEKKYAYEIVGNDEQGNPIYGYVETGETEEIKKKKAVTVSNENIESFKEMDWRFLYMFCLIRSNSFSPSYGTETKEDATGKTAWRITKKDVKDTFELLKMNIIYSYDVMTDKWLTSSFSYEDCINVPHTVIILYPEGVADVVKETLYIPTSLLNYGYSGYSGLYHTLAEGYATTIVENFEKERYESLIKELGEGYSDTILSLLAEQIPGAKSKVAEKFMYYKERATYSDVIIQEKICNVNTCGYEVAQSSSMGIFVPGSSGGIISPEGKVYYEDPSTPGEAAVNYAVARAHWGYSNDRRGQEGWWDCSSLVARSYYYGANVNINPSATTLTLLSNANKYKQFITESEMQPGDIWWFGDKVSDNEYTNRHVVMYCGNGMAIQAYGDKYGTFYHSVKDMKASIGAKLQFCIRPYKGISEK